MERGAGYRWLLVIALATMVNVGYGAIFYAFSVLLGEDAAAMFVVAIPMILAVGRRRTIPSANRSGG